MVEAAQKYRVPIIRTAEATSASMSTLIYFLVIFCAGWNFVGEFAINILLAPAINTIVSVVEKSRK